MNKIIPLSFIAIMSLYASDIKLSQINIESTVVTQVSQNAQISADLAEALSTSVPSIDMNRRSGIANDIFIRGQKRDNISVEVDGTKVCGACPNRMDPPVSHVLANQIDSVEVIEGPYDVETFGTMSGGVKIKTKKPTKNLHGEVNLGYGGFNYKKVGVTVSGGNDIVRVLVSGSNESSDQYKDGDGNTLSEQVDNYALTNPMVAGTKYQTNTKDMPAYKKRSIMTKAFVNLAQNQELRLSYTANRSNNILYPNTAMDAIYDNSNIYSVEYDVKHVTDSYKNINLQYYYSDVDHPMGTNYRISGADKYMTSQLKTTMQGLKLKNSFDIKSFKLLIGLDGSKRTWDGNYYMNGIPFMGGRKSINDAVTNNLAIFTKLEKSYGYLDFSLGARYDSTNITPDGTQQSNDYTALNTNLLTTYNINKQNKIFLGFGQASRVPDARELYFIVPSGKTLGTQNLDQTTNKEIDLGYEANNDSFKFKIKTFYSMLENYIYIQKGLSANAFQNIDAIIYGTELSGSYYATDEITLDMGVSYKKGEKDKALAGQTDKDLADIAPLRGNLAVNYEYMDQSMATLELQASDKWSDIDSDNGEQTLDAWSILNFKVKHAVNKNFDFTLGVNNLLDETYAKSNTYADLTLIATNTSDVMLLNEPGRYIYANLTFKF